MAAEPPLAGVARQLVDNGILAATVAHDAVRAARRESTPFITYLVRNGLANPGMIARSAAVEFGLPLFDLTSIDDAALPRDLVTSALIRQHHALPLVRRGARLFVAVSDPTNLQALDEFKFHTGTTTEPVVVEEDKLAATIERLLSAQDGALGELDAPDLDDIDLQAVDQDNDDDDGGSAGPVDETPIVRFVNKMLLDAIRSHSSDLHFEPYEKSYRVRFRTDGILHPQAHPPVALGRRLAARLKVMSQMDISERRIPQDGRIKMKLSRTRGIDFRVNTLPTLWGEKLVLRVLDPANAQLGIDMLGYEPDQQALYLEALHKPQGMVLVTGPTGSGKTVSLYTGLNILNTPERNISTAEDPVEINLEGINQVHVNNRVGLTFAAALRAFLRQDPDIIMVGEIRDLETAEVAIKAAQTGHTVLSTLHTNSAPETLTRLRNMGVPAFNLATSISLIVAQRLGRRLCSECKAARPIPAAALLAAGFSQSQVEAGFTVYGPSASGCKQCNRGYQGRTGIYEVVKVTDRIGRIIMADGNALDIADAARAEGFIDLRRAGLLKVIQGITSLEEIDRVTSGR